MPKLAIAAFALCFAGLFFRLGAPALWQDEAETAMLAKSVLAAGVPSVHLDGSLITVEPTLAGHESDARGRWIWNTWLPYYLTAGSFRVFGATPWAARFPFAVFAFLAFVGTFILFREEKSGIGPLWLAASVPWLLFMRQCRYYSLVCFGAVAAVLGYRLLLKGRRGAGLLLVGSLFFLLHSCFFYCPLVLAALALDALLRRDEKAFQKRFWLCAGAVVLLALPEAWYFRVWSRPGNHAYPALESLRFLRTYLLWLAQFAVPAPLLLAYLWRERGHGGTKNLAALACAYAAVLWLLLGEGFLADAAAAAALAGLALAAVRIGAPKGELHIGKLTLILCAVSLALFSWTGAEPYGRYLVILLPFLAYAAGSWVSALCRSREAAVLLSAACLTSNLLFVLPAKALVWLGTGAPAESVSGMMRLRLRGLPLRSEEALFWGELLRGPRGYIEDVAGYIDAHASREDALFSDSDSMSLLFATGRRSLSPQDFAREAPDWIVPSPWLALAPETQKRVQDLLSLLPYEKVELAAPAILWQANPDPLFHSFTPRAAPRPLYRLKKK